MKITYVDADTREIIDTLDDPATVIFEIGAERFAASLGAWVARICPTDHERKWTVELKIPSDVRRLHTPRPGERVRFPVKMGEQERQVTGFYRCKLDHAHVIVDDRGGEWELSSVWQIKKV